MIGRHATLTRQVAAFLIVNAFMWVLWALTDEDKGGVPWPVWVTVPTAFLLAWQAVSRRPEPGNAGGRDEEVRRGRR